MKDRDADYVRIPKEQYQMLLRLKEFANLLMLHAEDSKDEEGSVDLPLEVLRDLWEQTREYNEVYEGEEVSEDGVH